MANILWFLSLEKGMQNKTKPFSNSIVVCQKVSCLCAKFLISRKFTTIDNLNILEGLVLRSLLNIFGLLTNGVPADNTTVNGMLFVEMGCGAVTDKELGPVCVGTCICHRQDTLVSMGVPNLLILKLLAID